MTKNLILSCFTALLLATFAGCASEERHSSYESSATLSTDSKDMHHRGDRNTH